MEAGGKRHIVHGSTSDVFHIWNFADLHWMSKACAEDRVREDIEVVKADPYAFWFGGGDYCDFIGYRDTRFDPDAVAEWVSIKQLGDLGREGMKQVRDLFKPIAHKCLGLLKGNHEKRYELQADHEGLHGWLCTELGVPNLEYSALVDVVFVRSAVKKPALASGRTNHAASKSQSFRFYLHHGCGYAQTVGGKINRLTDFMNRFDADVYMVGHVHDRIGRRKVTVGADSGCGKLIERMQLGVISGSYLKTYAPGTTTYGEQRGYEPTTLGAAWVRIRPENRQLHAEI